MCWSCRTPSASMVKVCGIARTANNFAMGRLKPPSLISPAQDHCRFSIDEVALAQLPLIVVKDISAPALASGCTFGKLLRDRLSYRGRAMPGKARTIWPRSRSAPPSLSASSETRCPSTGRDLKTALTFPLARLRFRVISGARGSPVIRIPPCPLCRMLRPISSAVICSTMRAFSSLPPSMARTPAIFAASSIATCVAFGSSLHTMTSQSTSFIAVEHFRGNVLECRHDGNSLGNEFRRLLRRRALPDAQGAAGASAHARSQRNGGINQHAARTDRGL